MQQQPPPMMPMIPSSFPSTNITTEQIQKYLDENKQLILAILDNQNLGKLAECAQYQAQLQKNLMYLAAIADAQPQAPSMPSQMHPHVAMQQGGQYMQHPQATAQPPVFAPKVPVQFNPQQMQEQQQHQLHHAHQQSIPGHMIMMRPGTNNGMHAMHAEATHGAADFARGGGVGGAPSGSVDGRGGSKQDSGAASEAGSGDGHGSSAAGHGSGADAEPSYLKGSEEDAS